ncbi:class I SAM-dependent methyltransferase [Actinoplanes aureus]|uniref:Class I SAM-dependent methyltransferase n=1 Tax=Actinoplanes aureus TaxID=2792083 RepID=A0A931FWM1_9ACTN|nr:class I SAM-dependent methyltransferase [Actinoplanes aureus]MBG0562588.1 class I SAM-dependent methyltransferase [Actinoplanes aureus]
MPTLPSTPHEQRRIAESFGADAERYDRTRPAYPTELIARIVAAAPGPEVADVGCGTGTAARQFQAAGCRVLGVEPDERMARFARDRGLPVETATFEDWDPAGRRFDAVVAGTAWHWVDPVAGAAKAARILRPGGLLAAFWHVPEPPAAATEALGAAVRRMLPDSPFDLTPRPGRTALDGYQLLLDKAADGIRRTGGFTEPEQWQLRWERRYTRAEWLDQLPTSGILTRLPPRQLAGILDAVGAALEDSFVVSYTTVAVTATR